MSMILRFTTGNENATVTLLQKGTMNDEYLIRFFIRHSSFVIFPSVRCLPRLFHRRPERTCPIPFGARPTVHRPRKHLRLRCTSCEFRSPHFEALVGTPLPVLRSCG